MSSSEKQQQTKLEIQSRRNTKANKKQSVSAGFHEIGKDTKRSIESNDIDAILRAFDLDYKYGPCVGIQRIDRWERAKSLGLDPPPGIKDILQKNTGKKYQESLFDKFRRVI